MKSASKRAWLRAKVGLCAVILAAAQLTVQSVSVAAHGGAAPPSGFGSGSSFCANAVPGGNDLGAKFDNVYACGPANNSGTGYEVPSSGSYMGFFEAALYSYQCVELANRFLWVAYGLTPISGAALDGYNYVDTEIRLGRFPSSVLARNGVPNAPYMPGDIVSFSGDGGAGHVAVVTQSTYQPGDGGTYKVTLMEENASVTGQATAQVKDWAMQKPVYINGTHHITENITPHDFLELGWSIDLSANPKNSSAGVLNGIACPTLTSCSAAGFAGQSTGPQYGSLIEHWDGTRWSVQPSVNPKGAFQVIPSSIACPNPTACLAVGEWITNTGPWTTYAESWNGTAWVLDTIPNPSGSTQSYLLGVGCADATSCFAVGSSVNGVSPGYHTLIEHWNGTKWSIVPSPTPAGSTDQLFLSGIACPSSTSCFAVGTYHDATQTSKTLIEHWGGSSWHLVTSPDPAEGSGENDVQLNAVTCPSATSCTATGYYQFTDSKTLIEHWDGAHWTIIPSPNISGSASQLDGIACANATVCDATGTTSTLIAPVTSQTLIEHWDGAHWTIIPSPNIPGNGARLETIACPSPVAECHAVGVGSGSTALAEAGWP